MPGFSSFIDVIENSHAYELSDRVIERIKNDTVDSMSLGGGDLSSLIENRERCENIGALIGSNTHLKSLSINHLWSVSGDTKQNFDIFLQGVANNTSITTLDLGVCRDASINVVEILTPIFENNAMETIKFMNCNSTRSQQLAKALLGRSESKLKGLHLVGSTIGSNPDHMNDAVGAILVTILDNMDCLEKLTLDRSAFDKRTCLALKCMLTNPNCKLKELSLQHNEISSEGFSILGSIKNKTLEKLNLKASNRVSSGGWKHFFSMLKPNKLGALRILHLDKNSNMSDEGVTALSKAFSGSTTLEELYLRGNMSVTSTGWQALASLAEGNPNSALRAIDISGSTTFDDDAVFAWVDALQRNTKLDSLTISSRGITSSWGITSKGWSAFQNLVCNETSVDTIYDSNHTLSLKTQPNYWFGAPREVGSLLQTCEGFKVSSSFSRLSVTSKNYCKSDKVQRKIGLQKVINFYFKHGNSHMQELMEMDLNVLVFAIGSIASCTVGTNWGSECHGTSLMYKLIRSMPSLLDVSSLATLEEDDATATNA